MKLADIPESEPWEESDSEEVRSIDKPLAKPSKLQWATLAASGIRYALYGYFFVKVLTT